MYWKKNLSAMNLNDKFELVALFSVIASQVSNGRTFYSLHLPSLASPLCTCRHTHTEKYSLQLKQCSPKALLYPEFSYVIHHTNVKLHSMLTPLFLWLIFFDALGKNLSLNCNQFFSFYYRKTFAFFCFVFLGLGLGVCS